jgi:hypothetical protein
MERPIQIMNLDTSFKHLIPAEGAENDSDPVKDVVNLFIKRIHPLGQNTIILSVNYDQI